MKLADIVQKLSQNAGFEVFVHGAGRPDINDWHDDKTPRDISNYVRAVHNLKDPDTGEMAKVHSYIYILTTGGLEDNQTEPEVVAFGSYLITSWKRTETYYEDEIGWVRQPGVKGFFAPKVRGSTGEKIERTRPVLPKPCSLNSVVNTTDSSQAHFLCLPIRTDVYDGIGRHSTFAQLNIVASKELVDTTVQYLLQHPEQRNELMKGLLPEKTYPNVNKTLLSKAKPSTKVAFINIDNAKDERQISLFLKFGDSPNVVAKEYYAHLGVYKQI